MLVTACPGLDPGAGMTQEGVFVAVHQRKPWQVCGNSTNYTIWLMTKVEPASKLPSIINLEAFVRITGEKAA